MNAPDLSVFVLEDVPKLQITRYDLEKEFSHSEQLGSTLMVSAQQMYDLFIQMHNQIINSTQRVISSTQKRDLVEGDAR